MTFNSDRRVRLVTVAVGVAGILIATAPAGARDISVRTRQRPYRAHYPAILVMMKSFTRIVVVLSCK